jgi:hypothetical protein
VPLNREDRTRRVHQALHHAVGRVRESAQLGGELSVRDSLIVKRVRLDLGLSSDLVERRLELDRVLAADMADCGMGSDAEIGHLVAAESKVDDL